MVFGQATNQWRAYCLTSLLLAVFFWSGIQSVHAQGAGIRISPAITEPTGFLQPGSSHDFSLEVRNIENSERTLYVTPRNIESFGAGNEPRFEQGARDVTGLELADWITVSDDVITLPPGGSQRVDFTIAIPENAPPGSHFAGLYISADAPRLRESGAGVAYGVANIITLVVDGDISSQATIRSFSTDKYIYGGIDVTFSARVENAGNMLIRPYGPLEVRNMFGSRVAEIIVNESGSRVVPGNTRTYTVRWFEENPGFGRYQALLSLAYESPAGIRTMTNTVSFWILPLNVIVPAAGVLLFLLVAAYFWAKWYVRRSLQTYGTHSRKLVSSTRRRGGSGMPFSFLLLIVFLSVTAFFLLLLLVLFA